MGWLKILHLSSEKTWRGGEQQMAYLIKYLNSQGVDSVVCSRHNSAFSQWCKENETPFYEMSFKSGVDFRTALKIKRIARKEKADIVNSHSGKSHSLAYLAIQFGMQTPLVAHRRIDFPVKKSGFSLKKYHHQGLKKVICVSDAISKKVKEALDEKRKVITVHDGIDPARFTLSDSTGYIHTEFKIHPSKMLIANISAIAPRKDYGTFLQTAKIILNQRDDCHFLIVGNGTLEKEMKALAANLELTDKVTFTGFRTDISEIFRELTVFLITSDIEGLGTTVIDSLYNGIPVVATRAGGIPELIRDGKDGFLCPLYDAKCLAQKVEILLDSQTTRTAMKNSGHEHAKQFTNVKMGDGVLKVYREVLSEQ